MGFFLNKRAVSVALSTMIITAGVIAAGIAVLYWAYSWETLQIDSTLLAQAIARALWVNN